jgi:hypothetical protein
VRAVILFQFFFIRSVALNKLDGKLFAKKDPSYYHFFKYNTTAKLIITTIRFASDLIQVE